MEPRGWHLTDPLALARRVIRTAEAERAAGVAVAPVELGRRYEAALDPASRAGGAHYTPVDVAARLVELALGDLDRPVAHVWDPACGGGVFLLAAGDALAERGHDPAWIVDEALWGTDIDPGAVAVTRRALRWWAADRSRGDGSGRLGVESTSNRRRTGLDHHVVVGDALAGSATSGPLAVAAESGFDLVVGNPPFQSPLTARSARSASTTSGLRARWGADVVAPYTDSAALFLVAMTRALAPGGRGVLVLPTSVLGARDGAGARAAVDRTARVTDVWLAGEPIFDAAVEVCAVVVERGASSSEPVRQWSGRSVGRVGSTRAGSTWTAFALTALGVPDVEVRSAGRLGEVASASAGFRDEYYGLVDHVRELGGGPLPVGLAPLITSGSVDPGRCRWGDRPTRFARTDFERPVVDLAALAADDSRAARWVAGLLTPKVVVATQTRVGEAAVDLDGRWVASTPTVAVVPNPMDTGVPVGVALWQIAAVVCSPVGSVAALSATAGSARSRQAIRQTVASVAGLPLPVDREAWADGARALERGDRSDFVLAMAGAYALTEPDALHDWWLARVPWPT